MNDTVKKRLTLARYFANLQSQRLNNTRPASAGFGRISAPWRVTFFEGAFS